MPPTLGSLAEAVADAAGRYTRLVLLVGPKGSGKTALLKAYAQANNCPYSPVGALMAERLLATPPRFRDTESDRVLKELCQGPGPFLLDNLELLFTPELQLDPYRLLVGLARTKTVVAAWAGSLQNGTLTYAATGHKEYRSLNPTDAICIPL
ncbi:MAG TPA: BREX-3 system P-loop-containing protein BrxF [Symbiobacteriaceae bacterium]|nr:BREX-3 system P-loop-containing protein BrxF [Symbiobacteriaceae bacterium]